MQQVTNLPRVISPGTDLDTLLGLGDRRQIQMLPSALPENVTSQIPLVQALHDENNVLPHQSIRRSRVVSDIASAGLIGSSTIIRLPPRPVRVPPTDVERRKPRLVVMTSVSVFLAGS